MRILTLVHQFLPRNVAGTEIYTYHLSRALMDRGHEVHLLFSEIEPERAQGSVSEGAFDGIGFHRITCNFQFSDFASTYDNPAALPAFERCCRAFRPDVIHIQHLQSLSLGIPARARRSGLPVIMTLAEYLLLCPLWGQLIKRDLTRCERPSSAECGSCLAGAPFFGDLLRGRDVRSEVDRRRAAVRDLSKNVDLFIAPSRFLKNRFEQWGFPVDRIRYSDYGFRHRPLPGARSGLQGEGVRVVRFAYVGSWVPYKGVHLLPEAFLPLDDEPGWTLDLYGSPASVPDYSRSILDRIERSQRIRFRGPFPPERADEVFSGIDVLVVPSIWFENSPLTIHEAFLAGAPVLTSRLGGMEELVSDGRGGLLFAPGDASSLRGAVLRILREPSLLPALRAAIPSVKSIDENAAEMEAIFQEAAAARRSGGWGAALRRWFRPIGLGRGESSR